MTESGARVGFLGEPITDASELVPGDFAIVGAPFGVRYPAQTHDCSAAPRAIRERSARFAPFLDHHDFDLKGPFREDGAARVVDVGDVPEAASTTDAIRGILARDAVPIVLGGDDSIPIPVLRAYEGHGTLIVIQVDAHLDFRDEVDGVREGYSSAMRRATEMPWVERIIQVGLRGVGSATSRDVTDAEAAGNVLVTAREVHHLGIDTVFDQLPDAARYFISLDCDGLDPSVVPAVNAPLPGGLTFDECAALLRGLPQRGHIAGMAVTELLPERDLNDLSALVVVRLIWTLIGTIGRTPTA